VFGTERTKSSGVDDSASGGSVEGFKDFAVGHSLLTEELPLLLHETVRIEKHGDGPLLPAAARVGRIPELRKDPGELPGWCRVQLIHRTQHRTSNGGVLPPAVACHRRFDVRRSRCDLGRSAFVNSMLVLWVASEPKAVECCTSVNRRIRGRVFMFGSALSLGVDDSVCDPSLLRLRL
jgi:hypothetical protein